MERRCSGQKTGSARKSRDRRGGSLNRAKKDAWICRSIPVTPSRARVHSAAGKDSMRAVGAAEPEPAVRATAEARGKRKAAQAAILRRTKNRMSGRGVWDLRAFRRNPESDTERVDRHSGSRTSHWRPEPHSRRCRIKTREVRSSRNECSKKSARQASILFPDSASMSASEIHRALLRPQGCAGFRTPSYSEAIRRRVERVELRRRRPNSR